jgi:hypothetical protein
VTIIKIAEYVLMLIYYLKRFSDLKLKNMIDWIFQLSEDTKNVINWYSVWVIEYVFQLDYLNWFCKKELNEKCQFGTKTQLLKHSLIRTDQQAWSN